MAHKVPTSLRYKAMSKHNWEHFHLDDDNQDSKDVNESAYSFYDFSDEEIKQMEDDRIASLDQPDDSEADSAPSGESSSDVTEPTVARASAKERAQKFKGTIDGTQGSDFTAV